MYWFFCGFENFHLPFVYFFVFVQIDSILVYEAIYSWFTAYSEGDYSDVYLLNYVGFIGWFW